MPDPPYLPLAEGAEGPSPVCPRCSAAMTAGYVAFQGRTTWVGRIGALDASGLKGENLIGLTDATKFPHFRSWRCTACRLVLMDYGSVLYARWFWEKEKSPVVVRREP